MITNYISNQVSYLLPSIIITSMFSGALCPAMSRIRVGDRQVFLCVYFNWWVFISFHCKQVFTGFETSILANHDWQDVHNLHMIQYFIT